MTKKIERLEDLQTNSKNHNKGSERGIYAIEESIRRLGAGRSGLCDRNGKMIAGNHSLEAIAQLGIPVKVVPTDGNEWIVVQRLDLNLDEDNKAVELSYADNVTTKLNFEIEAEQLLADLENVDLSYLYTSSEIEELIAQVEAKEKGDSSNKSVDENIPEPEEVEPRCKQGEIWQLGRHFLGCLDSTDEQQVRRLVGDRSIDMVFSDPPYGIDIVSKKGNVGGGKLAPVGKYHQVIGDNSTDTAIAAYNLCAKLFPKATQVWWGANYYANALPPSSCWLVWDKENTGNFADAELAWTNHSSPVRIFKHQWNGMIKASEHGEKRVHPCQKPQALFSWVGSEYGKPGDTIFDPFLGSGCSLLSVQNMNDGRCVLGIEMSKFYAEIIMQRWEKISGETAQLKLSS